MPKLNTATATSPAFYARWFVIAMHKCIAYNVCCNHQSGHCCTIHNKPHNIEYTWFGFDVRSVDRLQSMHICTISTRLIHKYLRIECQAIADYQIDSMAFIKSNLIVANRISCEMANVIWLKMSVRLFRDFWCIQSKAFNRIRWPKRMNCHSPKTHCIWYRTFLFTVHKISLRVNSTRITAKLREKKTTTETIVSQQHTK